MDRFSGLQIPVASRWALLSVLLLTAMAFASLLTPSARANDVSTVVCEPTTGACYEYVSTKLTWQAAKVAAESIQDLRVPPGNRLERLSGNRAGQHSIRVNDQWRICFRWSDGDAYDVEIVDYH